MKEEYGIIHEVGEYQPVIPLTESEKETVEDRNKKDDE